MNHCIAVSALLALAGSSYGFVVNQFAVQPGAAITPSTGSFVNYASGYYLGPGSVVIDSRTSWKAYGAYILNTTFLAVDPAGGGPDVDGYTNSFSRVLAGPGGDPTVPQFSGSTANWLGTPGLLADGSKIDGGVAGVSWGAGSGDSFNAPSGFSPVNGVSVEHLFFGYFVLTDPNATLTGEDLLMTENLGGGQGQNWFLPLDGSPSYKIDPDTGAHIPGPYAIQYEHHSAPALPGRGQTAVLKGFVAIVPTPGAAGMLGMAGLAAIRRRRR
jgi:hypothetical protein